VVLGVKVRERNRAGTSPATRPRGVKMRMLGKE